MSHAGAAPRCARAMLLAQARRVACRVAARPAALAAACAPPPVPLRRRATALPAQRSPSALRAASADAGAPAAEPPAGRAVGSATPERAAKQELIDTQPPRGTRDFAPDDMRLRNWLFGHFREVSLLFGFEEWDAPVVENEQLYTRKAGEEITQQLYCFEDKGGRRLALRPELTPSLARMVLQKGKGLALPAKWFAVGQCWRYERMTRGRRREHYQWNMDIVGVPGIAAEAELLAAITTFFKRVGLSAKDIGIKVSNRKVLQAVLERAGVDAASFAPCCVIVDKMEKLPREQVLAELATLGVPASACDALTAAMALKSVDDLAALLGPDADAVKDLRELFALAEGYGFADWLVFDATVVRGLAYYTGTVFEAFDRGASLRAICGGGRYDRLLSAYGGEDAPCAGFGFGDAVIVELLAERGLLPTLDSAVDDVVAPLEEALRPAAAAAAAALRAAGRRVDLVLEPKKMKWVLKRAQAANAQRLVLLGGDEWAKGCVRVKELATREERDVPVAQLASALPPK